MKPFLANNIQVPFWLSDKGIGILINNYNLFSVYYSNRHLTIEAVNFKDFNYYIILGKNIKDVYGSFINKVGKPERTPAKEILTKPIFSTWVRYKKDVDEEKVKELAKEIKRYDFPCSVIQIDDRWELNYGDLKFDFSKFPNPKDMVSELHEMGYLVTLWVHPFINFESRNYRYAKEHEYLVLDPEEEKPATIKWWNGEGGLIDVSNPEAINWYDKQLQELKKTYGFDGFKFDAGDGGFFPLKRFNDKLFKIGRTKGKITPNQYTDLWVKYVAEHHPYLAELRVGYLAQRYGLVAREGDKNSRWGLNNGLHAVVTQALTLSLTGYPYIMPDMIGGNEYEHKCTKELFIRWTEAVCLMPIVEYSLTPWSFDEETTLIAKRYSLLHMALSEEYIKLANKAMKSGEPILYPLVLKYPDDTTCATINDEYLIGDILVAPILKERSYEREIYLPKGSWIDFWSQKEIKGPTFITAYAPLDHLPLYIESHNSSLVSMMRKIKLEIFKSEE